MTTAGRSHALHLVELGRNREALAALAPLVAEHPDDAALHALTARAHLGLGDEPAALRAANRTVKLRPHDEHGHRLRSIALHELDFHDQAVRAAEEAVRLAPHAWHTHQTLAMARLGRSAWDPAVVEVADEAVRLAPNEADAHFVRGLVAQRRGDLVTARAAYERAAALDPHHAAALNNLATLDQSRPTRQLRGFTAALRADPHQAISRENLLGVVKRMLARIRLVALVGVALGVVGCLATGHGGSPFGIGIGLAMLASIATLLMVASRATSRGVWRFVLSRLRTDPSLIGHAVVGLALSCLALVICWAPDASHQIVFGVAAAPGAGVLLILSARILVRHLRSF